MTTWYFYPRPPRGGRLVFFEVVQHIVPFLSTPSARRATFRHDHRRDRRRISIHALREEGDQRRSVHPKPIKISIHALREEGDRLARMLLLAKPISIHALREEGDTGHSLIAGDSAIFLSTPSARRATRHLRDCACDFRISIHALREEGDQSSSTRQAPEKNFYPRPPRGGRRSFSRRTLGFFRISIHALREEGDTTV